MALSTIILSTIRVERTILGKALYADQWRQASDISAIYVITLLLVIYKNKVLPLLREFRHYWQACVCFSLPNYINPVGILSS